MKELTLYTGFVYLWLNIFPMFFCLFASVGEEICTIEFFPIKWLTLRCVRKCFMADYFSPSATRSSHWGISEKCVYDTFPEHARNLRLSAFSDGERQSVRCNFPLFRSSCCRWLRFFAVRPTTAASIARTTKSLKSHFPPPSLARPPARSGRKEDETIKFSVQLVAPSSSCQPTFQVEGRRGGGIPSSPLTWSIIKKCNVLYRQIFLQSREQRVIS